MASNSQRWDIFHVNKRGEGKKSFWNKIGTAFENKDGSFSLVFDVLPVQIVDNEGRQNFCMRKHVEKEEEF